MRPRVPSLATFLAALPEYRTAPGKRYALVAFRVYVWVTLVCGGRSQAALADWGTDDGAAVRAPVGMAGEGGPRQATLQRLGKQVRRDTLAAARRRWAAAVLHEHSHADRDHRGVPACAGMASAGTPRRGSHQQGAPEAHGLRALRHRLQVGVGQGAVDATSTARTAIATRLPLVGGAGRMTTTAAWPTPRPVAQAILDAGGAYGRLGNAHQPPGLAALVRVFAHAAVLADPISEPRRTTRHGERRAARQLWTSTAVVEDSEWPGVQPGMRLERIAPNPRSLHVRRAGAYAGTALPPARAAAHQRVGRWRAHWCIETTLHDGREVPFDDDRSHVRTGHIPHIMAAVRNLALSSVRLHG